RRSRALRRSPRAQSQRRSRARRGAGRRGEGRGSRSRTRGPSRGSTRRARTSGTRPGRQRGRTPRRRTRGHPIEKNGPTPLLELGYKPGREMAGVRVGVVGGSGYTGSVAARLVATHPDLTLTFATSDRHEGAPLARHLLVPAEGAFAPNAAALEL